MWCQSRQPARKTWLFLDRTAAILGQTTPACFPHATSGNDDGNSSQLCKITPLARPYRRVGLLNRHFPHESRRRLRLTTFRGTSAQCDPTDIARHAEAPPAAMKKQLSRPICRSAPGRIEMRRSRRAVVRVKQPHAPDSDGRRSKSTANRLANGLMPAAQAPSDSSRPPASPPGR